METFPSDHAHSANLAVNGLSGTLWGENADLARDALAHPFVRGLGDGTLPIECFRHYVVQDAYFLEAFARGYALALARCPDSDGMRAFFTLLSGTLDELRLHASYAARWAAPLHEGRPAPATFAYTDFLLATASLAGVGETCAAMTPCMRLYAHLGQSLATEGAIRDDNPYHEWVETYASDAFESLAITLEDLLDRYAGNANSEHGTTGRVRDAYRRAMQLEVAFFDAAQRIP